MLETIKYYIGNRLAKAAIGGWHSTSSAYRQCEIEGYPRMLYSPRAKRLAIAMVKQGQKIQDSPRLFNLIITRLNPPLFAILRKGS